MWVRIDLGDGMVKRYGSKCKLIINKICPGIVEFKKTFFCVIEKKIVTKEWIEYMPKDGYRVFSIIVENRHGGVNEHGVPAEKLEQMKNRFQIKL